MNPPSQKPPAEFIPPTPRESHKTGIIITVLMVLLPFVIVGIGLSQFWLPSYQQDKLRKTGIPATGKLVNIEPTGSLYNDQPQVVLTILVHPMQGADFTAQTKMVINPVYLPQFQPGTSLKVYYDPKDRTKVAVE